MAITSEQDILELIVAGIQESLTLEYKRCAALHNDEPSKNEISKDVSSFANSAGGTLIYGVVENNHLPQALDAGFDPAGQIKREWLEQVIRSRIQPRIDAVVIRPINLSGQNAGRVALVVDVPQSHTAHQASDKKYYKRQNFTVVPMEDYEIRDVFNRAKTPLLVPDFAVQRRPELHGDTDFIFIVRLANKGDVSARSIRVEIGMPADLLERVQGGGNIYLQRRNTRDGRDYAETVYVVQREAIIFPQQEIALEQWGLLGPIVRLNPRKFMNRPPNSELRWTIYADDMRRQEGHLPLFPDLINY